MFHLKYETVFLKVYGIFQILCVFFHLILGNSTSIREIPFPTCRSFMDLLILQIKKAFLGPLRPTASRSKTVIQTQCISYCLYDANIPRFLQCGFRSSFLVIRPSSNHAPQIPFWGRSGPIKTEFFVSKETYLATAEPIKPAPMTATSKHSEKSPDIILFPLVFIN